MYLIGTNETETFRGCPCVCRCSCTVQCLMPFNYSNNNAEIFGDSYELAGGGEPQGQEVGGW